MDCHMRAEERMARRPKIRKRRVGLSLKITRMNVGADQINRGDSRGFHETINKRGRETLWTHCGCKGNKNVNFLVQLGVYT